MADHAENALIIGVGGGFGPCQHIFGVEDVQALVLHRPHIEIADRHDLIQVKVILQPETLLVPEHRLFQRSHRMVALRDVGGFNVNPQRHGAP